MAFWIWKRLQNGFGWRFGFGNAYKTVLVGVLDLETPTKQFWLAFRIWKRLINGFGWRFGFGNAYKMVLLGVSEFSKTAGKQKTRFEKV